MATVSVLICRGTARTPVICTVSVFTLTDDERWPVIAIAAVFTLTDDERWPVIAIAAVFSRTGDQRWPVMVSVPVCTVCARGGGGAITLGTGAGATVPCAAEFVRPGTRAPAEGPPLHCANSPLLRDRLSCAKLNIAPTCAASARQASTGRPIAGPPARQTLP